MTNKPSSKQYMTPRGYQLLQQELQHWLKEERPKLVETIRWAASNGDRSENADYIYGKRRLREIDRRIRYLTKQLDHACVVDPAQQQQLTQVFFGATVTYLDQATECSETITIVGVDEANSAEGKISYHSPLAKSLMKARVEDEVVLRSPQGERYLVVLEIRYIL